MGRAQFEYDEVGNTFYYVIVSFFAVVLFPLTYILWPSLPEKQKTEQIGCKCEGDLLKNKRKEAIKPWEKTKRILKAVTLLVLWALFILLAYKVSKIKHEHIEYDPYKVLGLNEDAELSEIKKKYRELSKTVHPDKGGDAQAFDAIVKAYKSLTDEETRQNWKLHGNPDGPQAITFGIALPKWIVSEKYGIWVLACYGLVFMILLPLVVGFWWYNSMKYSADKVLLETTRLYYYFLQKTPNMEVNRILMILAGSIEFWSKYNADIIQRESDDVEVPRVMKELKNLGENKRESPFCHPWSIKARTLIHAYLTRVDLCSERLYQDQNYIIGLSLSLLEEYVRVLMQMTFQIPMQRPPTLETLENSLRLFPMIVQALWPRNSTLLQLPHISEHSIPFLRKNRVSTCQDLANLKESKRRLLLNKITDEQYDDVIYVLTMMPKIEITTKIEVQGEDDKETVTVGSVVTLKVTLKRSPLLDPSKRFEEIENHSAAITVTELDNVEEHQPKRKVWEKQPKKKAKKGAKNNAKPPIKKKHPVSEAVIVNNNGEISQTSTAPGTPKITKEKQKSCNDENRTNSDVESNASDVQNLTSGTESEDGKKDLFKNLHNFLEKVDLDSENNKFEEDEQDDEEMWKEHEDLVKKETVLDSEPTNYHEVHCPFYPCDKYEWWYVYLVEKKMRRLISLVLPCKTLDIEKTIELRFSAPLQKGIYYFTLNVRSDSYIDSDYSMEVHEAREPPQIKYEDTEDEDEEKDFTESSDNYTEGSDSEEED